MSELPPYLAHQVYEVEPVPTHLCVCVSDVPGGPVGAYIADPSCEECEGLGVLLEPELSAEAESMHLEPLPFDHPALANEQWSATFGAGNRSR